LVLLPFHLVRGRGGAPEETRGERCHQTLAFSRDRQNTSLSANCT
jgi:hypothetical protein